MVGSSSNIYISFSEPVDNSGRGSDRYHRAQHLWMVSVEPHHSSMHIPGTSHKHQEPIHYTATSDPQTGTWTVTEHQITNQPGIIGNILIVEGTSSSPDKIFSMLQDDMGSGSTDSKSKSKSLSPSKDHASSDDEPEHWIRRAIHGLQHRSVAQTFDIDEFVTFAHGYVANRLDHEAPALIAYPKIHKEPEKKSSKHRFWVSYPEADRRTRMNSRGEASTYGGLM